MNPEERKTMRDWNRAQAKAYHHGRKWYNIDSISNVLAPLRAKLRRMK